MSFFSEDYVETICIQYICQPIVAKAISNAIASSNRSETVLKIRAQRKIKVQDTAESPSKVLNQPQTIHIASEVNQDIKIQDQSL